MKYLLILLFLSIFLCFKCVVALDESEGMTDALDESVNRMAEPLSATSPVPDAVSNGQATTSLVWTLASGGKVQLSLAFPTPESYHALFAFLHGANPGPFLKREKAASQDVLQILDHEIPFVKLPLARWHAASVAEPDLLHQYQLVCELTLGQGKESLTASGNETAVEKPPAMTFLFLLIRRQSSPNEWNVGVFRHTKSELIHALYQVLEEATVKPEQVMTPLKDYLEADFPECVPVNISFDVSRSSGLLRPKVVLMKLEDLESLSVAMDVVSILSVYLIFVSPIGRPLRSVIFYVTDKMAVVLGKMYVNIDKLTGGRITKVALWSADKVLRLVRLVLLGLNFIFGPILARMRKVWESLPFSRASFQLFGAGKEKFNPLLEEDPSDHIPLVLKEDTPISPHLSLFPKVDL